MKKVILALAAPVFLASGAAQATLVDRGGGLIYDTTLNVTWLANANYAAINLTDAKVASWLGQNVAWTVNNTTYTHTLNTSDFQKLGSAYTGRMTWWGAQTWAASLSYYDSVRGVTYDDWRLPTLVDTGTTGCNFGYNGTDCGYNVNTSSSELAHLWYVDFQNKAYFNTAAGGPQPGWGLVNDSANTTDESLFSNIQSLVSWSGLAYAPVPTGFAWTFDIFSGHQGPNGQGGQFYAWAVRPGDVAAANQAVPEPMSAALLGLGLAGVALARRRRALGAS